MLVFLGISVFSQKIDTLFLKDTVVVQEVNKAGVNNGLYRKYYCYMCDDSEDIYFEFDDLLQVGKFRNGKKVGKWHFYNDFK